jgi:hypothetical protein
VSYPQRITITFYDGRGYAFIQALQARGIAIEEIRIDHDYAPFWSPEHALPVSVHRGTEITVRFSADLADFASAANAVHAERAALAGGQKRLPLTTRETAP